VGTAARGRGRCRGRYLHPARLHDLVSSCTDSADLLLHHDLALRSSSTPRPPRRQQAAVVTRSGPPSADTYHRSPGGRRMRASTTGSTVAAGSHSLSPFVCMFVQRVAHEPSPCECAERPVPVAMATPWSGGSTC
jgi:hypothetical protein